MITAHLAHDLDYGYAEVVSSNGLTGDVASYCRTCDVHMHHAPISDNDSHDVRESPTRIRPYQARTVHYLGRLVHVSNAGVGNYVNVFTLQGTYGRSPGRLVATSHRSR